MDNLIENTNEADNRVFWLFLYGAPIAWVILMVLSFFTFKITRITICILGVILGLTNLIGY